MRESRFELLRIVAMFYIVLYHMVNILVFRLGLECQFIRIPLHIGVICFVLISGYWHIKLSVRGVVRLFGPILVIYVPLNIIMGGGANLLSPYWFVRVYFYLMLVSPLLNSYLTSNLRRCWMLVALGFISVYMALCGGDANMDDGKNVVLFSFLYVLGDTLRFNQEKLKCFKSYFYIILFVALNIILPFIYKELDGYRMFGLNIGTLIWRTSFPYSSPFLIINGLLLFTIFSKFRFYSKSVNSLAKSMFTVYIIQEHPFVLNHIIVPIVESLYEQFKVNFVLMMMSLICLTLVIIIVAVFIDKLFSPIWGYFSKKASVFDEKISKYIFHLIGFSQ